jgi:hypothetical protein
MRKLFTLSFLTLLFASMSFAQLAAVAPASTSTDVFVMPGTDVTRPGANLRLNFNVGVGHTFDFLHKDPFGDEITVSYTYENGGNHGFFHSDYGSNTETLGLMKNFAINKLVNKDKVTFYSWPLIGVTSMTGNKTVENRLYLGYGFGAVVHINGHWSVWIQETWNKVMGYDGYPSTNIGPTFSF